MDKESLVKKITNIVIEKMNIPSIDKAKPSKKIVTGVSVKHVHLTDNHIEELFGKGYKLNSLKDLSQPGQYAAKEVVTLVGSRLTALQNTRVLGPPREVSQVELAKTDCISLGVDAPTRISGNISGSAPIVIVGPKGSINLPEGAIRAERHIHMSPQDAKFFNLSDKSYVDIMVSGPRGLTFNNVIVRISPDYKTEFHVDTDDANTCDLVNGSLVEIVDASCITSLTEKAIHISDDNEIIPPTIPDSSSYVGIDKIKKDSKLVNINTGISNILNEKILTLSEVKKLLNSKTKADLNQYLLTPLALDYLKENNIETNI